MEYVIGALWSGLELVCCYLFNSAFLSQKDLNRNRIFQVLIVWLFACFYTNIEINQYLKLVLTLISHTILSAILLHGTLAVHTCLAIICNIYIASMDTIAAHGMCYLLGISYNTLVWRKLSYMTLITSDKFLVVFLAWMLYHFRKKGGLGKQHTKWVQLSALFPAVSAAMLAILFYTSPRDKDVSLNVVIFAGILMVANAAIIYVINNIEKTTEQEQCLRLLRQQISIQTENYGALKENYSIQRKSTHEFERHIQVLRDLLDQEEYESAHEYVRQLQVNRALKVFSIASNNPVIDVVLNQKYQLAQEHGIKMHVKVNDLSSVAIVTNELVVLLSNLLDNAIEGAGSADEKDREITVDITENAGCLNVRITNHYNENAQSDIIAAGKGHIHKGLGISIAKNAAEENKGMFEYTAENGIFTAMVVLPVSEKTIG